MALDGLTMEVKEFEDGEVITNQDQQLQPNQDKKIEEGTPKSKKAQCGVRVEAETPTRSQGQKPASDARTTDEVNASRTAEMKGVPLEDKDRKERSQIKKEEK